MLRGPARTLAGTLALIAGLAIYTLLAMRLATWLPPQHWTVELAVHAALGLAWLVPAAGVLRWIQAPR